MWESHIVVFLRGLCSSQIYKVCLRQQLCCLLVPESWEKSCLSTLGRYHCWCEFHNMRAQHWRGVEGKAGEDRREMLCGLRHWQVQRFACLCVPACACVCWRVCGRWREQWIAIERGGRDIEWESREKDGERYGRRLVQVGGTIWWPLVVRYTKSLQMSNRSWWCFIDQRERVFVWEHLYSLLVDVASDFRSISSSAVSVELSVENKSLENDYCSKQSHRLFWRTKGWLSLKNPDWCLARTDLSQDRINAL